MAVMVAVAKGRWSALTLRQEVAKLESLTVAANILTRYVYMIPALTFLATWLIWKKGSEKVTGWNPSMSV